MSSNSFAALDDSGDEAPQKVPAPASKKSSSNTIAPSSKPDPKSKPKNTDRNTSKHGRGGRPPVRDGKREYDRRSGTGRGKEIKKGGGGARNWGSNKDEAKKMEGRINEDEEIAPVVDGDDTPADVPSEKEVPQKEDNTMTFADYMVIKGKKEDVSLRETKNDFAGVTAAAKEEEESFMTTGGGKKKKDKKKKEADKKIIDVGFRAPKSDVDSGRVDGREDRRDSRGGRGDRRDSKGGRGRGGRKGGRGSGRGSGRGPRSDVTKKPKAYNVADEGAFPSL